jgi:ArsR family transcriptional regulator, arsenate/arsenite/antimonite-responsive transcriptional repressor
MRLIPFSPTEGATRCGAPSAPPLSRDRAQQQAALLKAVADPVRLQLISLIAAAPDREACVCDMTEAVGLAQPTVSHHLKVLTEAGVLSRERRGTWAWFSLQPARLREIGDILDPAGAPAVVAR